MYRWDIINLLIKKYINNPLTISVPDTLSYDWLEQNRIQALDLITVNEFLNKIIQI